MTVDLVLQRLTQTALSTFGTLAGPELKPLGVTLEPPPDDNEPDVSCIPAGVYQVVLTLSPHLGYITPELVNVPGRADIRMHIGNVPRDTEGCSLIGTHFGLVEGQHGILDSEVAFKALMALLRGAESITIEVRDVEPPPSSTE